MRGNLFLLLLICLALNASVLAQTTHQKQEQELEEPKEMAMILDQKDALEGIETVIVRVMPLKPDIEGNGLTTAQIRTDAELRLHKAGIDTGSKDEPVIYTAGLFIRLVTIKTEYYCIYGVDVEFHALAILYGMHQGRFKKTVMRLPIWSSSSIGVIALNRRSNRLSEMRDHINDHIDKFVNDYLAANPNRRRRRVTPSK